MTLLGKIIVTLIWVAISVVAGVGGFLVIDSPAFSSAETVALLALVAAAWLTLTLVFLMAIEG